MRCQCYDRYVDPETRLVEAAYGWLSERSPLAGTYWVSIDPGPPRYFTTQEAAREFFTVMTDAIRKKAKSHKDGRRFSRTEHKRTLAAMAED